MALEGWVTAADAARTLGVTVTAVHRLCARGTLASAWLGGVRFIRREKVIELRDDVGYQARSRKREPK